MKLPVQPPALRALFDRHGTDLWRILALGIGPEVEGEYESWDHLRYLTPPDDLSLEQWWLAIKLARQALAKSLPLVDKTGRPFTVVPSDSLQRRLFLVARDAAGALRGTDVIPSDAMRERYLVRSLIEE